MEPFQPRTSTVESVCREDDEVSNIVLGVGIGIGLLGLAVAGVGALLKTEGTDRERKKLDKNEWWRL